MNKALNTENESGPGVNRSNSSGEERSAAVNRSTRRVRSGNRSEENTFNPYEGAHLKEKSMGFFLFITCQIIEKFCTFSNIF